MHMAPRRDRRYVRRRKRSGPRAWTCALVAACTLVLLLGAGQAAARAADPAPTTTFTATPPAAGAAPGPSALPRLPENIARRYRPTIVCRNGAVDPARCRRLDARISYEPHSTTCIGTDGWAHLLLYLYYSNGHEWVRRAEVCGAWYDRRWAEPRFVERDHAAWGDVTFGPVPYCDTHIGRHCG
jgi:hypothetical protein